jgi:sulfur-oxidizing protein SoxY
LNTTPLSTTLGRVHSRRSFLALCAALLAGALRPLRVWAREWDKAAFDARNVNDALKSSGIVNPTASADIVIKAPEIAENGAQVPVDVLSKVPATDIVYLFVDKNPQPFVGSFDFMNGAEPFISTRIKMGETSNLRVVVRAGGKHFVATREIKVTIGGCGT